MRLASQLFENLQDIRILFVGAGEMNELVATHFAAKQPKGMVIANRSLDRAELLAHRFGADVMPLADLPERLHEFDAVISCTASTCRIIGSASSDTHIWRGARTTPPTATWRRRCARACVSGV